MTRDEFKDQVDSFAENVYLKALSRIAIVVFSIVGLPLAVWFANQLVTNSQTIAVIQANAANDREQIRSIRAELAERAGSRYTTKDAERDFKLVGERIDSLGRRVGANETRVDRLEQARTR